MEEGNEYTKRSQAEKNKNQARRIDATLEYVKSIDTKLDRHFKEIRAIRQDLRNLENLRPLRVKPDSKK